MDVSYQEFISYLSKYKNEKRAIFSKNILKTNKDVLGLKMKEIKDIAKVFSDISFIDFDLNSIYEVTFLYFYISLKREKELGKQLVFIKNNIKYVDSWGIVDSTFQLLNKPSFKILEDLTRSKNLFIRRYGYVSMLNYSKNNALTDNILNLLKEDDEYYVNMAEGWVLSYLLIYDFDKTYNFLLNNLNLSSIKKIGIQKAIDSFRVSDENKNKLRELRKKQNKNP